MEAFPAKAWPWVGKCTLWDGRSKGGDDGKSPTIWVCRNSDTFPCFARESSVADASWTVPCLGQPRGAYEPKHLHRPMTVLLEDFHKSLRSIDLWDTRGLLPIFSAAVPLGNYQLHQGLEPGTNEVLSEGCRGEYGQQSSSTLPCPAAELFPQWHCRQWEEIVGQALKFFRPGLARAPQLWIVRCQQINQMDDMDGDRPSWDGKHSVPSCLNGLLEDEVAQAGKSLQLQSSLC